MSPPRVRNDLADLTFLSSLGMGALVEYRRGLSRRGVEVKLANLQPQVWLALASAGLMKLFELIDLEEPARPAAGVDGTSSSPITS
jgi:anti-anti-sigma factor